MADTSAEPYALRPVAPEPAEPAADTVAGQTPVETADSLHRSASASDLDAGQAVIEQAGGIHVGKQAARRIGCDSGGLVLIHAPDGGVLDLGRRTRTVPTAMRRAREGRDRNGCQFPGCNCRLGDAHHVVHWADGGATELSNLVLVCRFHHRALHEEGFQVVADGAGGFQFLRPDGAPLPAVPPAPRWQGGGDPLAPTVARLAGAGTGIGPHTATPEWYGESLNVAAALDALWRPPVGEPSATVVRTAVP